MFSSYWSLQLSEVRRVLLVADGSLRTCVGCRHARHLLGWTRDVLGEENSP